MITDGEKDGGDGFFVELGPTPQWIQVDLGASHPLHAILLWHFHSQARVYRDVVVKVSDDPTFKTGVRRSTTTTTTTPPSSGPAPTRSTSRSPRAG